jgi:hypothetical protein
MTMTMMMMMEIGTDGGGHGGGGGGTTGVAVVHNGNDDTAGDNGVFVYIVQRRGYAGWQQSQSPPVDYRRLLMTRSEADQVAYGSAHHFAQGGPVRTIQLPDGTFGFVSANHLYWVRKVSATATTNGSSISNNYNDHNNNKIFGEAHCVLSDGLLGGTCPRRHVLVAERHSIYVGPHSAHAALQYLMSNRSLAERGATIQWVPVGPPPSLAQLAQEWPVAAASVSGDGGGTGMDLSESSTASSRSRSKRAGDDDDNVVWFHRPAAPGPPHAAAENDNNHVNRMVMETTRSTKRACWAQRNNNAAEQGMAIELNE